VRASQSDASRLIYTINLKPEPLVELAGLGAGAILADPPLAFQTRSPKGEDATAVLGIVRGWDEFSGADFLKSDNSGNWSQNGTPADAGPYLPVNYRCVLQRWRDNRVIDTKDADSFDLDELNEAVPKAEWEPGYNAGELRPPWQRAKQLILMNLRTGEQVIYSGSNIRCLIAVTQLIDQIRSKNFMFGRTRLAGSRAGERTVQNCQMGDAKTR
jgi:hypothetical protein